MHPTVVHLDHSRALGGAELALRRTLLASPSWRPALVLPGRRPNDHDDGPFEPVRAAGVRLRAVGPAQEAGLGSGAGFRRAVSGLVTLDAVARALRRDSFFATADVVHANTSRSALYGALAVRRRRQVFVVHLRDLITPESLGRFGDTAMRKVVLPRADAVVANSRATLDSARAHLRPGARTLVLHSPLGLARGMCVRRSEGPVRTVGMVARLAPWKGQALLVESFAKVFAGTDVRLRLVGAAQFGEHDYAAALVDLAEQLGIGGQLDLVGHVDDVAAEIASTDVCVQASLQPEPLGQNVLQYLALGRPTIVADAGGPVEWVHDGRNGLVFRTGDAVSLAASLTRLRDDADLRRDLSAAAAATPGILSDADVAGRLGALFDELVLPR